VDPRVDAGRDGSGIYRRDGLNWLGVSLPKADDQKCPGNATKQHKTSEESRSKFFSSSSILKII